MADHYNLPPYHAREEKREELCRYLSFAVEIAAADLRC
jgi:hypothetical protein